MVNIADYFSLLSLPRSFEIDPAALHQSYIAAQRASHPDKQETPVARLHAVQRSADINAAYRTLKEPLKRAEYLLSREGIEVGGEQGSVKPGQALLIESLEMRERLMEDADFPLLRREAEEGLRECRERFAALFSAHDFTLAAQIAMRWRFLAKFVEEIAMRERAAHRVGPH